MKAFVITGRLSHGFREIAVPEPGPGEVRLKPLFVGLCGSDLKTFRGENPLAGFPRVPGHELSAVIEAAGPGVPSEWREGTEVTVLPYSSCGTCAACAKGRPNACEYNQTLGVQRDGCLAERIVVPCGSLIRSGGLPAEKLALAEPIAVGCHAVRRTRISEGETIVVIGCGAVGLGAVASAAASGARVIAVDVDDKKLETARLAGGCKLVNPAKSDLHVELRSFAPKGPDAVIEAVGTPLTFRQAVEEVSFAGRVTYIGYAKEPVSYETKLFVQKELDIRGSRNAERGDFEDSLQLLLTGRFPAAAAITRVEPFSGTGSVLESWNKAPSEVTKILISMRE